MTAVVSHVRKPMPRRRGNSFYRDKRDLSQFAATLCGAPITDRDLMIRDVPRAVRTNWPVCHECVSRSEAA